MTGAMRNYEAFYQQKESSFTCYECQRESKQSDVEVLTPAGTWRFICEDCAEEITIAGTFKPSDQPRYKRADKQTQ